MLTTAQILLGVAMAASCLYGCQRAVLSDPGVVVTAVITCLLPAWMEQHVARYFFKIDAHVVPQSSYFNTQLLVAPLEAFFRQALQNSCSSSIKFHPLLKRDGTLVPYFLRFSVGQQSLLIGPRITRDLEVEFSHLVVRFDLPVRLKCVASHVVDDARGIVFTLKPGAGHQGMELFKEDFEMGWTHSLIVGLALAGFAGILSGPAGFLTAGSCFVSTTFWNQCGPRGTRLFWPFNSERTRPLGYVVDPHAPHVAALIAWISTVIVFTHLATTSANSLDVNPLKLLFYAVTLPCMPYGASKLSSLVAKLTSPASPSGRLLALLSSRASASRRKGKECRT